MKKLFLIVVLFVLQGVQVSAAELDETVITETVQEVEEDVDVQTSEKSSETVEYVFEFTEPIAVYEVNPDDYNTSAISTFAMNDSVYSGSYNSTVITLWNGLLANNVGKDYVAYRASQYEYYIFFGDDFELTETGIAGSGKYYYLNTYGNSYSYGIGEDSFNVSVGSNYIYTNVSADFPALDTERGLLYEQIQVALLIALLFFGVFRWIFLGR